LGFGLGYGFGVRVRVRILGSPWFHSKERKAVRAAPRTWLGLEARVRPYPSP